MATVIKDIRSKIETKLNEMQTLKTVYDFDSANPDGEYPLATMTITDGESEFISTAHNMRSHRFSIRVFQERTEVGQGVESAENISVDVLEEILNAFDMDTTLSGTVKYVAPAEYSTDYEDREHATRVLEVVLEAVEVVQSQ